MLRGIEYSTTRNETLGYKTWVINIINDPSGCSKLNWVRDIGLNDLYIWRACVSMFDWTQEVNMFSNRVGFEFLCKLIGIKK